MALTDLHGRLLPQDGDVETVKDNFLKHLNLDGIESASPREVHLELLLPTRGSVETMAEAYEIGVTYPRKPQDYALPEHASLDTFFDGDAPRPYQFTIEQDGMTIHVSGVPATANSALGNALREQLALPKEERIANDKLYSMMAINGRPLVNHSYLDMANTFPRNIELVGCIERTEEKLGEHFHPNMEIGDEISGGYMGVTEDKRLHIGNAMAAMDGAYPPEQVEAVLLHEYAHVLHGDLAMKGLTQLDGQTNRISIGNIPAMFALSPDGTSNALLADAGSAESALGIIRQLDAEFTRITPEVAHMHSYMQEYNGVDMRDNMAIANDLAQGRTLEKHMLGMPASSADDAQTRVNGSRLNRLEPYRAQQTRIALENEGHVPEENQDYRNMVFADIVDPDEVQTVKDALEDLVQRHHTLIENHNELRGILSAAAQARELRADMYSVEQSGGEMHICDFLETINREESVYMGMEMGDTDSLTHPADNDRILLVETVAEAMQEHAAENSKGKFDPAALSSDDAAALKKIQTSLSGLKQVPAQAAEQSAPAATRQQESRSR